VRGCAGRLFVCAGAIVAISIPVNAGLLRFDFVEYRLGGNILLDLFQLWIVGRKVQPVGKGCHQPGERGQLMFS
jgi:hypothetical protein